MKRSLFLAVAVLCLSSCGVDPNANADGDCMTDVQELELGTDPDKAEADADADTISDCDEFALGTNPAAADSDGDGTNDADEITCLSDPMDAAENCYKCGWKRNDPGRLASTGSGIGDLMENVQMTDQCGDMVSIWDFYGEYHILYMTAAW
jgi:hypothetical protein